MSQASLPIHRRILVIDDNPAIHQDFQKILAATATDDAFDEVAADFYGNTPSTEQAATFAIDSAFQGQEGLARVEAAREAGQPYAMGFVDVRMPPGWDGIETIARIWEVEPELQVVVCTAYSDYSWDDMIKKVGTSDRLVILKKPFDNIEVLQIAHTLTAKWHLERQVRSQITELERLVAERTTELYKSEAHFRVIAENVADLIAVVDPRGAHIYHSPSYEKVLGVSPQELGRKAAAAHIHPDDQVKVVLATNCAFETGAGQVIEYRMLHRDGSWRALEAHANPVRNDRGEIEHLVMVARDITQRRQRDVQSHHA